MSLSQNDSRTLTEPVRPRSQKVLFRIGVVLTTLMAIPNVVNGGGTLLGLFPDVGTALWVPVLLLGCGLVTFAAAVPAWRWSVRAIQALIAARLIEVFSTLVPFGPEDFWNGPEASRMFYLILMVVGTVVALLLATGLRRR